MFVKLSASLFSKIIPEVLVKPSWLIENKFVPDLSISKALYRLVSCVIFKEGPSAFVLTILRFSVSYVAVFIVVVVPDTFKFAV